MSFQIACRAATGASISNMSAWLAQNTLSRLPAARAAFAQLIGSRQFAALVICRGAPGPQWLTGPSI